MRVWGFVDQYDIGMLFDENKEMKPTNYFLFTSTLKGAFTEWMFSRTEYCTDYSG